MPRELMRAMLFDDRDSLNSDEDWGAFHEHEAAMMQILAPDRAEAENRGARGKKKKKKRGVFARGVDDYDDRDSMRGGRGDRGGRGGYSGYLASIANANAYDYSQQFAIDGSKKVDKYRPPDSGLFSSYNN